jgi:hypothetical protein
MAFCFPGRDSGTSRTMFRSISFSASRALISLEVSCYVGRWPGISPRTFSGTGIGNVDSELQQCIYDSKYISTTAEALIAWQITMLQLN